MDVTMLIISDKNTKIGNVVVEALVYVFLLIYSSPQSCQDGTIITKESLFSLSKVTQLISGRDKIQIYVV